MTGKKQPPSKRLAKARRASPDAEPAVAASPAAGRASGARGRPARSTALAEAVHAVLHPALPSDPAKAPSRKAPAAPRARAAGQKGDAKVTSGIPHDARSDPPAAVPPPAPVHVAAAAPAAPVAAPPPVAAPARPAPAPGPAPIHAMVSGSFQAPALPDFEALSRNMTQLMEESGKIAATYCGERRPTFGAEMSDAVQTLGQIAEHWFGDPARMMQAQTSLTTSFFELWADSARRVAAGPPDPSAPKEPAADKRFKDPEWRENPVFDYVHKAFLLGSRWLNDLVDKADGLDEPTREKARFYVRQVTSALSPSNFVPTNPELLRETLKENGGNLLRGMKMLAEDLKAGHGQLRIRQTDTSKFAVGVNMAVTPGKVVFRNDLIELLQYSPTTPEVLARPLLIVPPWINKFYVLDLNPEKSFIRWAVEQGLTVFLISWVNPDERHAAKDFEAYMREGILAALDEIGAITGHPDATAIGYCVGGTLLAVTLAYMAAHGDTRIASATLFTAQVDFSYAGDLKVFADEAQIASLEAQMKEHGFLQGAQMAQAFNMLRPEDLIWSYVVNNYLKGRDPPAFDLLAWNSDSTRMPAANHSFYLRNCYLENNLARGLMEIGGERLDLKRVTVPIYNLATREDHIAPAVSVFEGCQYFGGPVRYVLSGSGHVAGVVNPPNKVKYGYTLGPAPLGTLDRWLETAVEHPGSWWLDWIEWIRAQAPAMVAARTPGEGRQTLGDAPGTYVRAKA